MVEHFEATYMFHFFACLISFFSQLDGALMLNFDSLINLDLRRNSISGIDITLSKF